MTYSFSIVLKLLSYILQQIGRGIVLYICFLKGADEETVEKMGMCSFIG